MLRPRIEAVELHVGCHDDAWTFPDKTAPIVIAGANGTGKTTLVEGLLACLFGPGTQGAAGGRDATGSAVAARGPGRDEAWAMVRVARAGEVVEVRRDFKRGTVLMRSGHGGSIRYEGDVDPRARPYEARRHRQILADLVGMGDADTYAQTLFVRQGGLPDTRLGDHLFRVAAGGHARLDEARRAIAAQHREVTARPIDDAAEPGADARQLEKMEAEIAQLEQRLEAARAAGARRGPLTLDRDRMGQRLRQLTTEIDLLEDVHAALARGSAIEISARQVRDLARTLEQRRAALKQDEAALESAAKKAAAAAAGGHYPEDLPERLARVWIRWRDLERLRRPLWPAWLTGLLVLAAAASFFFAPVLWPSLVAAAGAIAAGAAWLALWLQVRSVRARLQTDLSDALDGVPGGDRLGRDDDLDQVLERFHAQRETAARHAEARARLAASIRQARAALGPVEPAGTEAAPAAPEPGHADRPGERAVRSLMIRIETALGGVNERLLRERREMDRVGDASLRLPDGVVPTEDGVAEALRERRAERRRVQDALQEADQELLERGTPAESLDALEASLAMLRPQREDLVRKATVLEAAYALLADGYAAFRERDQERLLRLVSDHVQRLTDGALGPLEVDGDLHDARVRAGGRLVRPTSPPLSFGDMHALLLGVRLGAAEFLGSMGVYPPLILDDPFAHLDPDRARSVWRILEVAARDRQVIITTQDALLLDALGVEPDILLPVPASSGSGAAPTARTVMG